MLQSTAISHKFLNIFIEGLRYVHWTGSIDIIKYYSFWKDYRGRNLLIVLHNSCNLTISTVNQSLSNFLKGREGDTWDARDSLSIVLTLSGEESRQRACLMNKKEVWFRARKIPFTQISPQNFDLSSECFSKLYSALVHKLMP